MDAMKSFYLIVAVFLSLSVSLFAQKGGDIGGVTLDPCAGGGPVLIGEPLPKAC